MSRFTGHVLIGAVCLLVLVCAGALRAGVPAPDKNTPTPAIASNYPADQLTAHQIGKMVLAVSNFGFFGSNCYNVLTLDCFTGQAIPSCEYPKGSNSRYLYIGAFWIGAVVGRDTLVSVGFEGWTGGMEFHADPSPFGDIVHRSTLDMERSAYEDAVSEEDYICVYTDTFTSGVVGLHDDQLDRRPHRPLNIEVTQRSYAWSYAYAEDFVLFDYQIRNIGQEALRQVYMGVYVDGDVHPEGCLYEAPPGTMDDDICGFLPTVATSYGGCNYIDTVNLAWIADNSGDLVTESHWDVVVPHVTATQIVRTPNEDMEMSFNWWVSHYIPSLDWGPQRRNGVRSNPAGGLGTPVGDRHKYYYLRNGEFDYDQIRTADIHPTDSVWRYPNQEVAEDLSNGYDTRYLLSFGPFTILPGQTLPISFAYVAGENFHTEPYNAQENLLDGYHPDAYYENVHFEDLGMNAMWASWVYDNPGVDTDGNGYYGEYRQCCEDTSCSPVWYRGDGVPDFRGASPPPAPAMWVEPEVGRIRVRWNGSYSETTKDIFLQKIDFEGYRVYMSLDSRETSYTLLTSYDRCNFDKYVWSNAGHQWKINDLPFSMEQLRCLYGDSCDDESFDPLVYTRSRPYRLAGHADSIFYFEAHAYNRSDFGLTTPIVKVYPDELPPHTLILDSADASELTEEGYLKYFEYEFTIENLLPSVQYYVNVTAFDFGSPAMGLSPLETSKTVNPIVTYPQPTSRDVAAQNLKVYVYPNPYRADGGYYDMGFEGRDQKWYIPDRMHRIHFVNLPNRCTIGIYSLDGDLIREWEHDYGPDDPLASHDTWDLITRNTQLVVSGLYYWTVEDEYGDTQIGKLVIIK